MMIRCGVRGYTFSQGRFSAYFRKKLKTADFEPTYWLDKKKNILYITNDRFFHKQKRFNWMRNRTVMSAFMGLSSSAAAYAGYLVLGVPGALGLGLGTTALYFLLNRRSGKQSQRMIHRISKDMANEEILLREPQVVDRRV